MSADAHFEKTVSFYRLSVRRQGRRRSRPEPMEPIDWVAKFARLERVEWKHKSSKGFVFDPRVMDGVAVLGMHKPLNTQFMSRIDMANGTIEDLLDEAGQDAPTRFAHSTGVAFCVIRGQAFVAMALGSGIHCPKQKTLELFLNEFVPPNGSYAWKVEPVMAPDDRDLLHSARGLTSFSATFVTADLLFGMPDPSGPVGLIKNVARSLGAEVEARLDLRLAPGHKTDEAAQFKMKRGVQDGLAFLDSSGSRRPRALATLSDGSEMLIDLAAHEFSTTITIDAEELVGAHFSTLLEKVRDTVVASEDELVRILDRRQRE